MVLEYKFSGRKKVVKGETYPIKRADLDEALENAGVSELEKIGYWSEKATDCSNIQILSATMLGEASLSGQWIKRSPAISVQTVPVDVSQSVKGLIAEQHILQRLADWLKQLEVASNVRRDQWQEFNVSYLAEGKLKVNATK